MNFTRWKFSKQVQPELEKFIKIVENVKKEEEVDELVKQILPKLPLSHCNLEEPSEVGTKDDVIVIDSDEESLDIKNETNVNNSVAILSLSEDTPKNDGGDFDVIKNTMKELLNDNRELEVGDIQEIFKEPYKDFLIELFNFLVEEAQDTGLLKLGETLNKILFDEEIIRQYTKLIFLKKLLKTESSIIFMPLVSTFVKKYPTIFREEILLPLLNENFDQLHVFEEIYKILPETQKETLFRSFLFSCQELEEGHLLILQPIVLQLNDFAMKQRLITLMSISADKFNENKIFMKMLIEIIKTLNKDFLDLEPILYSIIEKNKTIFKKSAEKTLNTWFNDCNAN